MKKNLPVTQVEETFPASANILSTTNLKGAITYVNPDFVKISGFTRDELVGQNHNMVRHPDMPPAAFAELWSTVKSGESWMGMVKNRCKNGNHYWVDAYVTPIEKNGEVKEYQSVRRKPSREHVRRAEQIYPQLMEGKTPRALKNTLSLSSKNLLWLTLPVASILLSFLLVSEPGLLQALIACSGVLLAAFGQALTLQPLKQAVAKARNVINNPVARFIYTGRRDDVGQLMLALKALESETAGLIGRIADSADDMMTSTGTLGEAVSRSQQGVQRQFSETDQVAAAVNEMSASIQEVADNAHSTSTAANEGRNQVEQGRAVVTDMVRMIGSLRDEITRAAEVISQVQSSSNQISTVLNVINDIAEQTNLLALNAAIEAARAGDAGRGFAVVADEVRSLASRTSNSTDEIRNMIKLLQNNSRMAVEAMEVGQRQTGECVDQGNATVSSLEVIWQSISQINDMSMQIAAAVEQQSAVADEINRSVVTIRDMSESNLEATGQSGSASDHVLQVATGFRDLAKQFWAKQNH
ncbi:PAS domain-containing methyl-accepting chemotaxis protein [Marinobacterium sp. MBR-109]|jgi:aerotaxis receptor|uniref:methyl-accepting chemotaxis protein n=1 Tax=Marinobacterium sp. MBR-109 TaxID=3156462 RepID=UPI0033959779